MIAAESGCTVTTGATPASAVATNATQPLVLPATTVGQVMAVPGTMKMPATPAGHGAMPTRVYCQVLVPELSSATYSVGSAGLTIEPGVVRDGDQGLCEPEVPPAGLVTGLAAVGGGQGDRGRPGDVQFALVPTSVPVGVNSLGMRAGRARRTGREAQGGDSGARRRGGEERLGDASRHLDPSFSGLPGPKW